MATVALRLRGLTPLHLGAAGISALPAGYSLFLIGTRHLHLSGPLLAVAAVTALLPWLARAWARAQASAKCDEVAVHVRGEALPYRTLTEVSVDRSPRRHLLRLRRGDTVELTLILWDAFAGRLEPLAELERRLTDAGHPIPQNLR